MKNFVQEGMKAFKEGNIGNPYKKETAKHRNWEFGFNSAYFKNLREVKQRESET